MNEVSFPELETQPEVQLNPVQLAVIASVLLGLAIIVAAITMRAKRSLKEKGTEALAEVFAVDLESGDPVSS
jgi:hypothetical protein